MLIVYTGKGREVNLADLKWTGICLDVGLRELKILRLKYKDVDDSFLL